MPHENSNLAEALARLARAAQNGNRAKRRLARKLATMSPEQLRGVNPDVFARLGPSGLTLFAAASRNFKTLASAPQNTRPVNKGTFANWLRRKWHFCNPLIKCVVVATLIGFCGIASRLAFDDAAVGFSGGSRETIDGWPICSRLDMAADGCVYRVSSDRLTLSIIVVDTGISEVNLLAWNKHVDFRFAIPAGSLITIPPRGTLKSEKDQ